MLTTVQSAGEAFTRFDEFVKEGLIVQGQWHGRGDDGRELACALGVLGPDVDSPGSCPAQIMPRWLAKMVPWMFDRLELSDALEWGRAFYEQLARLDGKVPFSVIYDWQGNVVTEAMAQAAEKVERDPSSHRKLQELHRNALQGSIATRAEWHAALKSAYADADAYASADADAYASADADASASASADAYASASASAYAYAYASAYASASASAYASASASRAEQKRARMKRLAFGLVECLKRVPSENAQ